MSQTSQPAGRITRILVANRGEIARRIFRTVHDLGLASVAVFSDADADQPHVREADIAVRLPGVAAVATYLDADAVLAAAAAAKADAIHPGYGFLAENAAFAQAVLDAGLVWIGPTPRAIAAMGDKLAAKELVRAAGVPLAPHAEVAGDDPSDWAAAAERVGLPLLVKAAAGGGGRGMRLVVRGDELAEAVAAARREAASTFGDGTVFLERYVSAGRHVEVQVVGDCHGNRLHLFERDCSVQRRHQKVIEEAPAPRLSDAVRERMHEAALAAAAAVDYTGLGTVEFLVEGDGDDARFYFLEMNTRLQVEHPVTELVTGLDLVRMQIEIARGEPLALAQRDVSCTGHAVEARLYAEDPKSDYLPSSGPVHRFALDAAAGLRCDSAVESGSHVSPHYDPMLAKVVTVGADRDIAVDRLVRALQSMQVHGPTTNRDLLIGVLADPDFRDARLSTDFLTDHPALLDRGPDFDMVGLHAAAVALVGARRRRIRAQVHAGVPAGWRNVTAGRSTTRFDLDGVEVAVAYRWHPGEAFAADVEGVRSSPLHIEGHVRVGPTDDVRSWLADLETNGVRRRVVVSDHGDGDWFTDAPAAHLHLVELPTFSESAADGAAGGPTAPVPGTVTHVAVSAQQRVNAGTTLVVLEAMKMEHRIVAESDSVVVDVPVGVGDSVEAHQVLVVLHPVEES